MKCRRKEADSEEVAPLKLVEALMSPKEYSLEVRFIVIYYINLQTFSDFLG